MTLHDRRAALTLTLALLLIAPTVRAWATAELGLTSLATRAIAALVGAWMAVSLLSTLVDGYASPGGDAPPMEVEAAAEAVDA